MVTDLTSALAAINAATVADEVAATPDVKRAAQIFAAAAAEVNQRLAQCVELIKGWNRAEALRLAAVEPDLLDRFGKVNIRRRSDWDEIVADLQITPAPPLDVPAAGRLEKAFDEHQPVKSLLARYRTMQLARAGLGERIGVLRLLARKEPANRVWIDDIAEHEAARLGQIRDEAESARRDRDWEAASALLAEAEAADWHSPMPLDVLEEVRDAHRAVRTHLAAKRAGVIAPELDRAVKSNDLAAAQYQASEAQRAARELGLEVTDRAFAALQAGLKWAKEESRHRKRWDTFLDAVDELKARIRAKADWHDVRDQYRHAAGFGFEVPGDAEALYQDYGRRVMAVRIAIGVTVAVAAIAGAVVLALQ